MTLARTLMLALPALLLSGADLNEDLLAANGGQDSDLFDGAVCALTPTANSNPEKVAMLESFWEALGTRPLRLPAELHDDLVSRSSHLPHVVASELANYVLSPVHPKEQGMLCANGFRDTTRIASGSPEMWRDIVLANRKNVSQSMDAFIAELKRFQAALKKSDGAAVEKFFSTAKARRDGWCAGSKSCSTE